MKLIRWNPLLPATRGTSVFHDEIDRLFDGLFDRTWSGSVSAFLPAAEIHETPEAFVVSLDLPGVATSDVRVSLVGDTLTIRGEKKPAGENGSPSRSERVYGSFERSFTLGAAVNTDQVKATYRDGVLEVRVPKAEEAKVRDIEVQVG